MRFLVFGAGAVGSYYGGRLAAAGHHVTLVGRPDHVRAIRDRGLLIDSVLTGQTRIPLLAAESADNAGEIDVVLVAVKTPALEEAAQSLGRSLGPATRVLTLQNGVDSHEVLGRVLGQGRVFPSVAYVSVRVPEPGTVTHSGRGEIVLAEAVRDLAPIFSAAGIPATVAPDIAGALWAKMTFIAATSALSMIGDCNFGKLAESPDIQNVIRGAVEEIVAATRAHGIALPMAEPFEQVMAAVRSMASGISSMCQDRRANRRIEVEALNGVIVRMGAQKGIPTPVNATILAIAKLVGRTA